MHAHASGKELLFDLLSEPLYLKIRNSFSAEAVFGVVYVS